MASFLLLLLLQLRRLPACSFLFRWQPRTGTTTIALDVMQQEILELTTLNLVSQMP